MIQAERSPKNVLISIFLKSLDLRKQGELLGEMGRCTDTYSDVTMAIMAFQITCPHLFVQPFLSANIKESIKAHVPGPLWGEFTGDRWIPFIKSQ